MDTKKFFEELQHVSCGELVIVSKDFHRKAFFNEYATRFSYPNWVTLEELIDCIEEFFNLSRSIAMELAEWYWQFDGYTSEEFKQKRIELYEKAFEQAYFQASISEV